MKRLRKMLKLRPALRELRSLGPRGGPKVLRVLKVGSPHGLLVPTVEAVVEVEAHDGTKSVFEPLVPLPFLAAWGYRIGHALHLPLIKKLEPSMLEFEMAVPDAVSKRIAR